MPVVTSERQEAVTVTLSPAAVAVLAGLVAPSAEVSQDGILAGGEIWAELQGAFPLQAFWSFVADNPESYEKDFGICESEIVISLDSRATCRYHWI